ncbi:MAG: efflux RND transporter periplasmic adaptor subunit [Melioribacteraceae bacterium]|nr:efflux RND transporter periplasmic adaptor subunit [Melioribacteraceae bacterium]MCF8355590.1 efflux RND transporter periplasmic adaptor subunit [Melioribacteraceae bacterium]MCF8395031.1 efflux RND transporter periplasmic adaptor subunit [Melioribacteraceae bacterium]MCF8420485.1 efflux RND transporter periplasmic adaptor subunit [Melioribacteraceae bacterium]
MDRELTPDYVKKLKWKKIIVISSVILVIVLIFWAFKSLITPTLNSNRIRTAVAEIGDVESTLNASGLILPESEQNIISPIQSKILAVSFQSGEFVEAGKSLMELDRQTVENEYNKIVDENELKKIQIKKQKLAVARSIDDLSAQLDVKKLRVKSLTSSLEREKKLMEIGASTTINVEQADLNLQIEKRELTLLETQIENQKQTLNADLQKLELELQILARSRNELKNKLNDSYVRPGKDGVITWIKKDIGTNVNKGEILAKVADLNSYKVEATISDMHANRLFAGEKVRVRIGGKDFSGMIKSVSPSISGGVVNFIISLDDKSNPLLKPNMRVEVFVILSKSENVVRVKNGPFFTASSDQYIFVVKGDKAYRTDVVFGGSNFDYVEIKKGIKEGDRVIISNMEEYYHMPEIEIN